MRTWFDCMDFSATLKIVELIEKCCSVNVMSKTETAIYLFLDYEIEPTITEMVWEELEKQNPEFFKAHKLRRAVKTQIEMFNWLVVQQIAAMHGNLHNISADALSGLASSAGMPPGMNGVADRPVRDLTCSTSTHIGFNYSAHDPMMDDTSAIMQEMNGAANMGPIYDPTSAHET